MTKAHTINIKLTEIQARIVGQEILARIRNTPMPHPKLESLPTAATHPSGVRYEWTNGLPQNIPRLTSSQVEEIWSELADEFAIEAPTTKAQSVKSQKLSAAIQGDPIAQHLINTGRVKRTEADGRLHIFCPWESDHTTESSYSSTTYFCAHTGGYSLGHFSCQHVHCHDRTDQDFIDAIEFNCVDEFEALHDTHLDIRHMQRAGLFRAPWSGQWQWVDPNSLRVRSSLGIQTSQKVLTLRYKCNGIAVVDDLTLHHIPCKFGGTRVLVLCPSCKMSCGVLYLQNAAFKCRKCHGLTYTTQSETKHGRLAIKRDKLAAQLAGRYRPKGMHKKTYLRIRRKLIEVPGSRSWAWQRKKEKFVFLFLMSASGLSLTRREAVMRPLSRATYPSDHNQ